MKKNKIKIFKVSVACWIALCILFAVVGYTKGWFNPNHYLAVACATTFLLFVVQLLEMPHAYQSEISIQPKKKKLKWSCRIDPSSYSCAVESARQKGGGWRLPIVSELLERDFPRGNPEDYWAWCGDHNSEKAPVVRRSYYVKGTSTAYKNEEKFFFLVKEV